MLKIAGLLILVATVLFVIGFAAIMAKIKRAVSVEKEKKVEDAGFACILLAAIVAGLATLFFILSFFF